MAAITTLVVIDADRWMAGEDDEGEALQRTSGGWVQRQGQGQGRPVLVVSAVSECRATAH